MLMIINARSTSNQPPTKLQLVVAKKRVKDTFQVWGQVDSLTHHYSEKFTENKTTTSFDLISKRKTTRKSRTSQRSWTKKRNNDREMCCKSVYRGRAQFFLVNVGLARSIGVELKLIKLGPSWIFISNIKVNDKSCWNPSSSCSRRKLFQPLALFVFESLGEFRGCSSRVEGEA